MTYLQITRAVCKALVLLPMLALLLAQTATANTYTVWSGETHTYASLLASDDNPKIKLGAKTVFNNAPSNAEQLVDLTAEVLLQATQGNIKTDEDTTAWLAKAIGQTQKPRYLTALQQAKAFTNSDKVARYIEGAIDNLNGTSTTPYVAGSLSLPAVRAALAQALTTDQARRNPENFSAIQAGTTIDNVYEKIGLPDKTNVSYDTIRRGYGWVKTTHQTMQMQFEYTDIGAIRFKRTPDTGNGWVVDIITAYAGDAAGDTTGNTANNSSRSIAIRQRLATTDGSTLRVIAKALYTEKTSDEAALDEVAARIQSSINEKNDDMMVDALAWLCRVLEQANNPRYTNFLNHVSSNAASKKLRKYAKRAMKNLPESSVQQFSYQ